MLNIFLSLFHIIVDVHTTRNHEVMVMLKLHIFVKNYHSLLMNLLFGIVWSCLLCSKYFIYWNYLFYFSIDQKYNCTLWWFWKRPWFVLIPTIKTKVSLITSILQIVEYSVALFSQFQNSCTSGWKLIYKFFNDMLTFYNKICFITRICCFFYHYLICMLSH